MNFFVRTFAIPGRVKLEDEGVELPEENDKNLPPEEPYFDAKGLAEQLGDDRTEIVARTKRNFSPAFLDLVSRKFYLYAGKAQNGVHILNSRHLPHLLIELQQPKWFVEAVEKEVRDEYRQFLTFRELLIILNYNVDLPDEEVLESFYTFDKNGDGTLSEDELKAVLCDSGKYPLTEAEFDKLFHLVDADGSGVISVREFLTMWQVARKRGI